MEKCEIVSYLNSKGYDSYEKDGIVMVRTSDHSITKSVNRELKDLGYCGSFGFNFVSEDKVSTAEKVLQ